jgi:hypothetical protein
LAGGGEGYVDIEDVYWKCFELAPRRFAWRTRPNVPDLQKISVARRDAIKKQAAAGVELVAAQEADVREGKPIPAYQWRLTATGVEWVATNSARLSRLYGGGSVPAPTRRPDETRLRQIRESKTFKTWESKGRLDAEIWELADLLECSPSSAHEVWDLRLDSIQMAARQNQDTDILKFVADIRNKLKAGTP